MILVIAIGFGAMPGVLALGLHTMGFSKILCKDIEHINKGPIDALKSSGATKSQTYHLELSLRFYLHSLQIIYIF